MGLWEDIQQVAHKSDFKTKYPDGINALDMLDELHKLEAPTSNLDFVLLLDVRDMLESGVLDFPTTSRENHSD